MDAMNGHWAIGVGQFGCLHNHQERAEDLDSLLYLVADLYDLNTAQKNALRHDKFVPFEGEQREMNGDYIELWHDSESLDSDE